MRASLQRYEVWVFFVLIIIANTTFIVAIDHGILPFGLYNSGRFLLLGTVLIAVVALSRGGAGIVALLVPLTRWRVTPGWGVFAALWAATLCLSFLAAQAVITGRWPDDLLPGLDTILRPSVARTVLIGALVGEIVWVSYAISNLAPRFGSVPAGLIVGTVWTGWWAPIVGLNVGVIPDLPIVALWINMLGVALVCGFVYEHTRSGLLVLLLQIGVNSAMIIFPVVPATGGLDTYWAFSVTYLVAAMALHQICPPKRGNLSMSPGQVGR